jgi:uridine kinase
MSTFRKIFLNCIIIIAPFFYQSNYANTLSPLLDYLEKIATEHHSHSSSNIPIVAIGGCPGVGKTSIAKIINQHLEKRGITCNILHIDDFNLPAEERKKFTEEWGLSHFHHQLLHDVLKKMHENERQIAKPTYDQVTGKVGIEIVDLTSCDLIIFEGLYALCSLSPLDFFEYCDSGIYLEADEGNVTNWKWQREQTKTSPRSPEQFSKHMQAMLNEFQKNIAYSKRNAAFIVKKDGQHHYTLEEVGQAGSW